MVITFTHLSQSAPRFWIWNCSFNVFCFKLKHWRFWKLKPDLKRKRCARLEDLLISQKDWEVEVPMYLFKKDLSSWRWFCMIGWQCLFQQRLEPWGFAWGTSPALAFFWPLYKMHTTHTKGQNEPPADFPLKWALHVAWSWKTSTSSTQVQLRSKHPVQPH